MATIDNSSIASVTALVAVVFGPLVALYVARKQINASIISVNRQTWINTLRDCLSEFLTLLQFIYVANCSNVPATHETLEKREKAYQLSLKINLLINPKEDDHTRLVNLISAVMGLALGATFQNPMVAEWKKNHAELIPLVQKILKDEWERVKTAS